MKMKLPALLGLLCAFVAVAAPVQADEDVSKTLKEISEKQDKILQGLEEIKAELNRVKIRVSSS